MYGLFMYPFHMNFTKVMDCGYASFTYNTVFLKDPIKHSFVVY